MWGNPTPVTTPAPPGVGGVDPWGAAPNNEQAAPTQPQQSDTANTADSADSADSAQRLALVASAPAVPESSHRARDMSLALAGNLRLQGVAQVHLLVDGAQRAGEPESASQAGAGDGDGDGRAPAWVNSAVHALPQSMRRKLHLVLRAEQPTYAELFAYANAALAGRLVMIAHADIELHDTSLACLNLALPGDGQAAGAPAALLTLTRHPHPACPESSKGGALPTLPDNLCLEPMRTRDGKRRAVNSADAFVFRAPVAAAAAQRLTFLPNRRGAENRLAHVMALAGYEILNPCHAVRIYHRHCDPSARAGSSALQSARVDGGGQSRALPRTPLECPAWGDDQRAPLQADA